MTTAQMKTAILPALLSVIQDAQQAFLFEATRDDTKRYLVMSSSNAINLAQRIQMNRPWHLSEVDDRMGNLAYWLRCAKEEGERAHPAQTASAL